MMSCILLVESCFISFSISSSVHSVEDGTNRVNPVRIFFTDQLLVPCASCTYNLPSKLYLMYLDRVVNRRGAQC
jgi:hypothetical protein